MKKLSFAALLWALCLATALAQNLTGRITANGKGVAGVTVSDGIVLTQTDANGCYAIQSNKSLGYVFYSLPSGYQPQMERGFMPRFWQPLLSLDTSRAEEHNFELQRSKASGKNHVMLFCADVHLSRNNSDLKQFATFIPTIENERKRAGKRPIQSLFLGDTSWDVYWTDKEFGLPQVWNFLQQTAYPIPLWAAMGNHDNDPSIPASPSTDFLSAAMWRTVIGPSYYSFNIGQVHYVVLDDIVYKNEDQGGKYKKNVAGSRNYNGAFTQEQLQWLERDLATVADKRTPIVICLHIPVFRPNVQTLNTYSNIKDNGAEHLGNLVADFKQVHILSGHTHVNATAQPPKFPNIIEHNVAALCASWWRTGHLAGPHVCQDGSPGGYLRWEVNGRKIRHTYCPMTKGDTLQLRLYDMNPIVEAYQTDSVLQQLATKKGLTNYAALPPNMVYANVFAWDSRWKLEAWEDGHSVPITRITGPDPGLGLLYKANPKLSNIHNTHHLFQIQAKQANSRIRVRATDPFGRKYEQTLRRPLPYDIRSYQELY